VSAAAIPVLAVAGTVIYGFIIACLWARYSKRHTES
jgi:hypothetical protein